VGIYLGEGQFIHASSWKGRGKHCVKLADLATDYFAERLVSIRRVVTELTPENKTP
jgi:cell wall-associated NlpC family hydrolase